jgi:hypothetical protein
VGSRLAVSYDRRKRSSAPPRVPEMNSSRMPRTIGAPSFVATGASMPRPPLARGAPGSQPEHTRMKPRRNGSALPRSAALCGWLPGFPPHRLANSSMRPRLFTSCRMRPLPRCGSAGRKMQMSLRYSTKPRALRGALSILTMPRLHDCVGSISPIATPSSRSYAPALPNVAPLTNGARCVISIAVIIGCLLQRTKPGKSFASVSACSPSRLRPSINSRTTKPRGDTSSTARLV